MTIHVQAASSADTAPCEQLEMTHHAQRALVRAHLTSRENLFNKSVSIAIANSAASTVPNAGIKRVLLDPGVGYLETANNHKGSTDTAAGGGRQPEGSERRRRRRGGVMRGRAKEKNELFQEAWPFSRHDFKETSKSYRGRRVERASREKGAPSARP